ncbi:uncharacterized protein LOC111714695 [Eurytemora carolleeae]|uniref:uncharacterized protein LOC111714695 n=1 Tax=Eurytemora carolleeae TaxID=1294199 RepID=UPI000C75D995|nr:uncharacterized protein LOC111714695 [Eurytemora carolleeae]|eukprot:XP_023345616.1 uncharacterized protein LOC111714695 [Eurytemora affinis]
MDVDENFEKSSTMSIRRMKQKVPLIAKNIPLEKLQKYRKRLEEDVEDKEKKVMNLANIGFETRIRQEEIMSEALAKDLKNMWMDIDTEKIGENLSDKKSILTSRNLEITESLLGVSVNSVQTRSLMKDENDLKRSWIVHSTPSIQHPEIKLKTSFTTLDSYGEKTSMPTVFGVKFRLEGLDSSELSTPMEICQEDSDIQLFTRILREYIHKKTLRDQFIEEVLRKETNVTLKTGTGKLLEYRSEVNSLLFHLCLNLDFKPSTMGWKISWVCKFTETGKRLAISCNLPETLITKGTEKDWTPEYAMETLGKLSHLYTETPSKSQNTAVSSLSTPLSGQHPRPPKRRLN